MSITMAPNTSSQSDMHQPLQILYEQYRTEHYGPWHTRECYPWEYDVKAQECINIVNSIDRRIGSDSEKQFFLQQAQILQDRATYIRQQWAKQEATRQAIPPSPPASPAPQQTVQLEQAVEQEQEQEQEEQPLQQTNVKNIVEKIQHATDSKANSTVTPITLHQASRQNGKDSITRLSSSSKAIIRLDKTPTHSLTVLLASRLASLRQHVGIPPYIRQAEDMEATGQG